MHVTSSSSGGGFSSPFRLDHLARTVPGGAGVAATRAAERWGSCGAAAAQQQLLQHGGRPGQLRLQPPGLSGPVVDATVAETCAVRAGGTRCRDRCRTQVAGSRAEAVKGRRLRAGQATRALSGLSPYGPPAGKHPWRGAASPGGCPHVAGGTVFRQAAAAKQPKPQTFSTGLVGWRRQGW